MKEIILFLFSLILCLGKAFVVAEHFIDKKNVDPVVQNINRFIATLNPDSQHLQGGAIAILYKGKPIYEKTFGYRVHGQSQPINVHTLFPLASVSKTITAMIVAMMLDQNRLDLDKPYTFGLSRALNLRTILSHTTGYNFSGNEAIEQGKDRSFIKNLSTGVWLST